jgi:multisubunit Na+/H+ antiporter MnhG subunit
MLLFSSLAILRTKEKMTLLKIATISNFYIFPLVLIAIGIDNISWKVFIKIFLIQIFNSAICYLFCYQIIKKIIVENEIIDAKNKL